MSKLYTESEVRKLLNEILTLSSSVDDAISTLTHIELPTVIEIVSEASIYGKHCNIFSDGVTWTLYKIKGGSK